VISLFHLHHVYKELICGWRYTNAGIKEYFNFRYNCCLNPTIYQVHSIYSHGAQLQTMRLAHKITFILSMANAGLITLRCRTQSMPSTKTNPLPSNAKTVGCVSFFKKYPDLFERICLANSISKMQMRGFGPNQYRNGSPGHLRQNGIIHGNWVGTWDTHEYLA
jgi:hypothetical protein